MTAPHPLATADDPGAVPPPLPPPPPPSDPPPPPTPAAGSTRTGAVWVTGTGAFLLLAAAAVFVAVRWGEIPASAKLGAVAALTGAFVLAGRHLRPTLPATAGALFHLGVLLVPVDVAALASRASSGWGELLLAEGLVCTVAFGLAARVEGSVVLRRAAAAAVVVAAAGLGATTPVPAPLLLVGAAAVALAVGRSGEAVPWALLAGLAPVAGIVLATTRVAPGVVERLGLVGGEPRLVGLLAGGAAAVVLGTTAHRRLDPALAHLAVACAVTGATVSGVEVGSTGWTWVVGTCAVLATLEAGALLLRDDPFWARPADQVAALAEVVAVPGSVVAAGVLLLAPIVTWQAPHGALAAGLLTATWAMADLRRRPGRGTPVAMALLLGGRVPVATLGLAACAPAAALLATGSGPVAAVALVAVAALLLAGGRPLAAGAAVAATTLAPLASLGTRDRDLLTSGPAGEVADLQLVCLALAGWAGGVVLARALRWRLDLPGRSGRTPSIGTWALALCTPLPVLVAAAAARSVTGAHGEVLLLAAGAAWTVALAADPRPGTVGHGTGASHGLGPTVAARLAAVAVLLVSCAGLDHDEALLVAGLVAALVVVDALRLDEPDLALGLVGALPVVAVAAGGAIGLATPRTGVGMALGALVLGGLAAVLPVRWRLSLGASAGTLAGLGLLLATGERAALADALLVVGGTVVAGGVGVRRPDLATVGGATMVLGSWVRLVEAGVGASEPYLVPVAVLLLTVGHRARHDAGSWVTIGPAVALLGGGALAERLAGGGGWHALAAGSVGLAAVVAGGAWRLAAPLLLGTGLLAVLAVHESLGVTAGVPTWAWLAIGGAVLLGSGVAMERAQLGPVASGRRLVDVVQQRFG